MKPLIFILFLLFSSHATYGMPPQAEIVLEWGTETVVHQVAADVPIHPASLTKLMTLDVFLNLLDTGVISKDTSIPISSNAASKPNTKLGLQPGMSIRAEDAVFALTVHSSNDIATAIAEFISGTEERFAKAMTERAHRLGFLQTYYANASGLPHPGNRTTVREIALLGMQLMQRHPTGWKYLGCVLWNYGNKPYANTNRLLGVYPGMDVGKTGFIRDSGFNLFASAERNGRRFIVVVIGGRTAAQTANRVAYLLDRAFSIQTAMHHAR